MPLKTLKGAEIKHLDPARGNEVSLFANRPAETRRVALH